MHQIPRLHLVMESDTKALIANLISQQRKVIDQHANGIARLEKQLKDIVDCLNDLYAVISDIGN